MREIRPSGSEGGARSIPCPYPYRGLPLSSARREQATRPRFFLHQHPEGVPALLRNWLKG